MPWSAWQDGWVYTGSAPIDGARHWDPADSSDTQGTGSTINARVAGAGGDVASSHRIADGIGTGHFYRVQDDGTQAHVTMQQIQAHYTAHGPTADDLTPLAALTAGVDYATNPGTGHVIEYDGTGPGSVAFDIPVDLTAAAVTGPDMTFTVSVGPIGTLTPTTVGAGTGAIPNVVNGTVDVSAAGSPIAATIHGTAGANTGQGFAFSPKGLVDGTGIAAHPSASPFDWHTDLAIGDAVFLWTTKRWRYWIPGSVGGYWGVRLGA